MESQYFPNHDEKYFLWRAKELELDVEWRSVFKSLFLEKIERILVEILLSILHIS